MTATETSARPSELEADRAGRRRADVADLAAARPLRKDVWRRFQREQAGDGRPGVHRACSSLVAIFAPLIAPYRHHRARRRAHFREGPSARPLVRHRHHRARRVQPGRLRRPGVAADRRARPRSIALVIGLLLGAVAGFFGGLARHAHHARHRHLPRHPLHRPRRRHRRGVRPQRERGDPRARAHRLAGHLPASCGRASCRSSSSSTSRRPPRSGFTRAADHVPPHPAQRPPADHRLRHHRHRLRDPRRGGAVVPRRRPAGPDAGVGPDGGRGQGRPRRRRRTCCSSPAPPSSSRCSPSCSSATASATPSTRSSSDRARRHPTTDEVLLSVRDLHADVPHRRRRRAGRRRRVASTSTAARCSPSSASPGRASRSPR